jgi:flagellar protein FliO/FliZ
MNLSLLKYKLLVASLLFFIPFFSFAEEATATLSKNLEPSSHLWQIISSLALILLLIFVSAWLLKRFGRVNGLASNHMQVLANMAVGQRERVILLQVGKEQLLLGVTASKVNLLHELKEPIDFSNEDNKLSFKQSMSQSFSSRLQQAVDSNTRNNNKVGKQASQEVKKESSSD